MNLLSNDVRLLVYSLAAFRITYMLWTEDGPYDVFDWMRHKFGIYVNEEGQRWDSGSMLGRLLNCPLCLSVWVSAAMAVLYAVGNGIVDVACIALAMSGICIILFGHEKVNHE